MDALVFLSFLEVDGVLVEVVLGVEVEPDPEGEEDCLLHAGVEGGAEGAVAEVGVEGEEGAQGEAPLEGGEGEGVAEDVLGLQVVQLLDGESVVCLRHHN